MGHSFKNIGHMDAKFVVVVTPAVWRNSLKKLFIPLSKLSQNPILLVEIVNDLALL